ncbi:hypothetical protein SUGI_1162640 [Cryptomeria japonica]|uniref:uncharacterized protein LOC131073645 n=1 Tax=Cryptomeria japonica TaxID=3369 RepID=UPI0024146DA6|nr:uncharacterized protein LOC131073645 [Cryptomeria japonica]GLJ54218.1 hypothetical protein SUGI_1162640 [Cryptomeria japonica]
MLNWALAMDFVSGNKGGMYQVFQKEAVVDTLVDVVMCLVPVWLAVMIGLVVGWAWKPKWASLLVVGLRSLRPQLLLSAPHGFSAALTAFMGFPLLKKLWTSFRAWESEREEAFDHQLNPEEDITHGGKEPVVTNGDLEHLCRLLEVKDGGPVWHQVMDRATPTMSYQAWRRDPKVGPPQYRSRTVYEDVTPELLRDFFWDDEFRAKWDDMQLYSKTLEECPQTGSMIVHWIKKFPAFCSDREYVIGRRIWESGRTYLCVTKGVPYPSLPRHNKPRRVDLYYSSWSIRAVESRNGDGQLSACEVVLFHHEDMGIPWEIAKLGVRQGMWGAVRNIERGICAYKVERHSGASLSRCAFMARINSKVPTDLSRALGLSSKDTEDSQDIISYSKETEGGNVKSKTRQGNGWKFILIGGAMALACGLDRGIVSKAVIFGVARKLGNIRKRQ